jgi:hypothetical protein
MKVIWLAAALVALTAAPSMAQTERGYFSAAGGFTVSPETTSGNFLARRRARRAAPVSVRQHRPVPDVQPSEVQAAVDATTASLSSSGLDVLGSGRVPACPVGGVRFEVPTRGRVAPYALGGVGFAHLMPTATFTYQSGTMPNGTTPSVGDDVSSEIVSAGAFTTPDASNSFMFTLGGGIAVPVAHHWAVDAGYRFSRIDADTPINTQGMTFGFGYRF